METAKGDVQTVVLESMIPFPPPPKLFRNECVFYLFGYRNRVHAIMWKDMKNSIKKTRRSVIGRRKRKRIEYTLRAENMKLSVGELDIIFCNFKH
jgi:hypothetical protein